MERCCRWCGMWFSRVEEATRHERELHSESLLPSWHCDKCLFASPSFPLLLAHSFLHGHARFQRYGVEGLRLCPEFLYEFVPASEKVGDGANPSPLQTQKKSQSPGQKAATIEYKNEERRQSPDGSDANSQTNGDVFSYAQMTSESVNPVQKTASSSSKPAAEELSNDADANRSIRSQTSVIETSEATHSKCEDKDAKNKAFGLETTESERMEIGQASATSQKEFDATETGNEDKTDESKETGKVAENSPIGDMTVVEVEQTTSSSFPSQDSDSSGADESLPVLEATANHSLLKQPPSPHQPDPDSRKDDEVADEQHSAIAETNLIEASSRVEEKACRPSPSQCSTSSESEEEESETPLLEAVVEAECETLVAKDVEVEESVGANKTESWNTGARARCSIGRLDLSLLSRIGSPNESRKGSRKTRPPPPTQLLKCNRCPFVVKSNRIQLTGKAVRHVLSCLDLKPYSCTACGYQSGASRHACGGAKVVVVEKDESDKAVRNGLTLCFPTHSIPWKGLSPRE